MAAKVYRLLRAVLMTEVVKDKILTRNPCRSKKRILLPREHVDYA